MVAVVVILAAAVSAFALGFGQGLTDPGPNVAQTTGEFVPGASTQKVRVTHVAGDSVDVENLEIVVRASGPGVDTEARLVDLPADDYFSTAIGASNIQQDKSLIDEGNSGDLNQIIVPADSNTWVAGDTIQFAINVGGADFREPPNRTGPAADELEVVLVHTPSNTVLSEQTFTP